MLLTTRRFATSISLALVDPAGLLWLSEVHVGEDSVERTFDRDQAQALVPDILARSARLAAVRADLVNLTLCHNAGEDVAIADIKALEAQMSDLLDGFRAWGLHVTGYAPLLLDFPTIIDDREASLCWLENEPSVNWWHEVDHGFMGRRRL